MTKYNFSYDQDSDDLFIYSSRSKSKGSIEIGDIILDLDSKKEIVGVQIMHASALINDMVDNIQHNVKDILMDLQECHMDIKKKSNMIILKIFLASKSAQMSPILSIPRIKDSSPALAYA